MKVYPDWIWLLEYFNQQRELFRNNHYECIRRTNNKLNMEIKDDRYQEKNSVEKD